ALGPYALHAEQFGELGEARVAQLGGDRAAAEKVLLDAPHVPERAVVEDDRRQRDLVLGGRGELLHAEHEAAIAVDRDDPPVRVRHLRAKRGREAGAERALVAGRNVRPRLVDGEAEKGPVADL